MYKFEISADSPQELNEKMIEFAEEKLADLHKKVGVTQLELPQYVDEVPGPTITELVNQAVPIPNPFAAPPHVVDPALVARIQQHPGPQFIQPQQAVQATHDQKGMPYDPRIHSSSKALTRDGSWKYRRGADDNMIAQVEAQIKGQQPPVNLTVIPPQGFQPIPQAPASTVAVQTPVFQTHIPGANPFERQVPAEVAAPVVTPSHDPVQVPQGARPVHNYATFKANFTMLLSQLVNEGKINTEWVQQMKDYFKIKEIWEVLGSEQMCLEMFNSFATWGFITKVEA